MSNLQFSLDKNGCIRKHWMQGNHEMRKDKTPKHNLCTFVTPWRPYRPKLKSDCHPTKLTIKNRTYMTMIAVSLLYLPRISESRSSRTSWVCTSLSSRKLFFLACSFLADGWLVNECELLCQTERQHNISSTTMSPLWISG